MKILTKSEITEKLKKNHKIFFVRTQMKQVGTLSFSDTIHEPEDVVQFVRNLLEGETREQLLALYLLGDRVVALEQMSSGTSNSCQVPFKDILQSCFLCNARSIILVHNHVSGNLTPSRSDIDATKRMKKCAELLDMALLDHIIVSSRDNRFLSMKVAGYLDED